MNFKYIDTHAHVNFPDYDSDRDEVIKLCQDAMFKGVGITLFEYNEALADFVEKHIPLIKE